MEQQSLISFVIALIGILVQMYIARKSREQLKEQIELNHDMQNLISNRSATSFIADKRQKWIDELRQDMSLHLSLSREILLKWDAIRSLAAEKSKQNPDNSNQILQELAEEFSKENGQRHVLHDQQYFRIKFRLNPSEELHKELREYLDKIKDVLTKVANSKSEQETKELCDKLEEIIDNVSICTEKILKQEWERVKKEVKNPNESMDNKKK